MMYCEVFMKEFTGYMHGINLGGWLSQCNYEKQHLDTFILENDIATIKKWGMDHIRLPVDYNLFQNEDGTFKTEGFIYVDNCIQWCKNNGLNMILDLHKTAGFSFDKQEGEFGLFTSPEYQEKFYSLWEEFTKRYAKNESMMCFELLNEITDQSFSKPWNAIAKTCIERIRALAPSVKILVGSYWNNSLQAVKDLDPPYDENIIYNFHCYEPLIFTHQGGTWLSTKMNPDFRMNYKSTFAEYNKNIREKLDGIAEIEGFPEDKMPDTDYFDQLFKSAVTLAEERDVLLYCGEYGVIDRVPGDDTVKWFADISRILNKYGIGRAAWTYKQLDFGLSDSRLDDVRPEILKLL